MSVLTDLEALESQVVSRLRELEPLMAEYRELRAAADRLGLQYDEQVTTPQTTGRRRSAQPKRTTRSRSRSRSSRAASRPTHRDKVLRLVEARPDITVTELGQALGVDPTGLYRVVRKLVAEKQLVKDGTALRLASTKAEPA